MPLPRSIVIHGHFYQPPREDPWLDEVEAEPSAAPAHDWNQRIEEECYRAVAAARLPGPGGRIARIVNLYEWVSFNFGPTLLEWMERAAPETYRAVLEADRASAIRVGHGNAVAMPYHHAILPLSSRREKITEVRWGIADFRRRFGREPAGMWLPETAVDEETLDVLAEEGIHFTILAPHQVDRLPARGLPGRVRTAGGRSIAVFVYDGPISHDVAFGPLVRDAASWSERLLATPTDLPPPALISVATDGETYGHHHHFGEMALAMTIERVRQSPDALIENFASFLARHGAEEEIGIVSPSAWSCTHGVERWRSDCGCRMAYDHPSSQRWRTPLREAVGWLTTTCHTIYDRDSAALLRDPAGALSDYGSVIGAGAQAVRSYVRAAVRPQLGEEEITRAAELLEMERGALRTLTSCAWFFDDIGGLEPLQVLRYAAWVIALGGAEAHMLEEGFTRRLALAESNVPSLGTGRDIYLLRARPHLPAPARIAAGLAAARTIAPEAGRSLAWRLEGADDALTLTNARTGRSYAFAIALERHALNVLATVRSPLLDSPVALPLADLPDRQRGAIAEVLRGGTLARLLTDGERQAVARGDELRPVVRAALVRRVAELGSDHGEMARHDVEELLQLLEQLGQAVPFEAQTLFYRIWRAGDPGDRAMAALAARMGFVTEVAGPA